VLGQNSILRRVEPNTTYEEVKVRAVRLDDYFSTAPECCLWIDVEGSTGKVISGGAKLLERTQALMVEVEDRAIWQGQWLSGQVLEFLYDLGLTPVARDFEWWPNGYNVVCLRNSLMSRAELRLAVEKFQISCGQRPQLEEPKPPSRIDRIKLVAARLARRS
jgi:hypothetical protein